MSTGCNCVLFCWKHPLTRNEFLVAPLNQSRRHEIEWHGDEQRHFDKEFNVVIAESYVYLLAVFLSWSKRLLVPFCAHSWR